jgi:VIT1/CCC1 family predicted Fe2+/Mn2+ transporter
VPGDDKIVAKLSNRGSNNDWPTLLARIVDDVARIIQTEIRLFQAALTPIFGNVLDRFVANMVALAAFVAGGICMLAAFAFFLHQWMGWAPSLAITGVLCVGLGLLSTRVAKLRADQSMAELDRAFRHAPARSERKAP